MFESQQPKNESNKDNSRTLIIGFSNCRKTFLMNYLLFQKQEQLYIITKPLNRSSNIKAQTSGDIKPQEFSGNGTVVFDDLLLSK